MQEQNPVNQQSQETKLQDIGAVITSKYDRVRKLCAYNHGDTKNEAYDKLGKNLENLSTPISDELINQVPDSKDRSFADLCLLMRADERCKAAYKEIDKIGEMDRPKA